MRSREQIVLARPQDVNVLRRLIALSFHDLASSAWPIPDSDSRARLFPGYFRLFVAEAMAHGYVYTTAARDAVALWISVTHDGEPVPIDYDAKSAATTGRWADRFRLFDELLAKRHPAGLEHDHLLILAVYPGHQHQDIGSTLLATHHERLDGGASGRAAYLEAVMPGRASCTCGTATPTLATRLCSRPGSAFTQCCVRRPASSA